jgi:hypothetical protein
MRWFSSTISSPWHVDDETKTAPHCKRYISTPQFKGILGSDFVADNHLNYSETEFSHFLLEHRNGFKYAIQGDFDPSMAVAELESLRQQGTIKFPLRQVRMQTRHQEANLLRFWHRTYWNINFLSFLIPHIL